MTLAGIKDFSMLKKKIKMIIAKKMGKFLKKPSKTLRTKSPKTRPANFTQRVV